MQITLKQAQEDCNASLIFAGNSEEYFFDGACSDNRLAKEGNLFVCIKGENNDGHNFAEDAVKRGAKAILAERNPFSGECPVPILLVENSVKALGQLAHKARLRFGQNPNKKVIGITGTAGKTSLKELVAHTLSIEEDLSINPQKVAKNLLNYNTQVGMPISVLNASGNETYWVFELGISHANDMHELGSILVPDMAIILNAANGHTEGLGDKGVAYYKAQLINFVQTNGKAFASADYPDLFVHAIFNREDTVFFSTSSKKIPYNAKFTGVSNDGFGIYDIHTPTANFTTESIFIGEYGAENCIACASLALELGLSVQQIQKGMKTVTPPQMRFNKIIKNQWTIIDDTYNANPLSTARMIDSASQLAQGQDFIIVLGEMKELGDITEKEHQEIGKIIGEKNPTAIFFIGSQANAVQKGLEESKYQGIFKPIHSEQDFILAVQNIALAQNKHFILFKGSRSNHLEKYVNLFVEQCNAL